MRNVNKTLFILSLVGASFMSCTTELENADYQVIPAPQELVIDQNEPFIMNNKTKIIIYPADNDGMQRNAGFLAEYVKEATGKSLKTVLTDKTKNAIILQLGLSSENPEAYQLNVNKDNIIISGASEAGVFYGIQTLRKSLPITKTANVSFPAVKIQDYPRFAYRGMMLDVSRHFFTLDSIKRYIDMLALHDINRFHWHLSEDQGWRIEIKKYPELTKVGSMRSETVIGHNTDEYDGKPYGGFYTQEEAKEIVAYARDRYITVIPEIDLPGHMQAALASYPELGCTGGPYEVWKRWGISEDVLCAGNPKTIEFIEGVLDEITEIFPSEYIHIGGDECPKVRWKNCPKCQAMIKKLGLKSDKKHSAEDRLQSYVMSCAEKFLDGKGRRIIGWDEILEGDLIPEATVMSWRGTKGGIEAAKRGHDVIMAPNVYAYFDYYQTKDTENEPLAIGGFVPVDKVYSLEPVPASLTNDEKKFIVGVQANLWTEYIPTFSHVEYMVLPRMAALSEVQWTMPEKKDYQDFLNRLSRFRGLYDLNGYNYAKHVFEPQRKPRSFDDLPQ